MENNMNNNVSNNINSAAVNPAVVNSNNTVNSVPGVVQSVAPGVVSGVVQNSQVNPAMANSTTTNVVTPNVNTINSNGQNTSYLNQSGSTTNMYVVVGSIVGIVLVASVVLLVLLVTGVIGSRNRLTCTRRTANDNFTLTETRLYKFDKGLYTSVNYTHVFEYHTSLTDDMYNSEFAAVLNNNSNVSSYGFDTKITRSGDVVTITAFEPRYWDKTMDDIKTQNKNEGFICE